jgi:glycine dehydrogenase
MGKFYDALRNANTFIARHIGPNEAETKEMLRTIGVASLDELIEETVPADIRRKSPLNLPEGVSEHQYLQELREIAAQNKVFKSYIGLGYYDCVVPSVILRNVFENPAWYTAYTPYQAEIAQGRLEALINFQTAVADLTALPIANASLLDEATAAAEAMGMFYRLRSREQVKNDANVFCVSKYCFPQTLDVLKVHAEPLGIVLEVVDPTEMQFTEKMFGVLLQYPDVNGEVRDNAPVIRAAKDNGLFVAVATDLLSLTLLTPPGEMGADVAVGSSQRFGVPMGYGGPHAAFFACKEEYKRQVPGRIIGVSIDRRGLPAFRMALQTREQHIRREKATSNICTAQTLLANMAGLYAVYHGPEGLKNIATQIHIKAKILAEQLEALGFKQINSIFFDTLRIDTSNPETLKAVQKQALQAQVNFRYIDDRHVAIGLDETTTPENLQKIVEIFAAAAGKSASAIDWEKYSGIKPAFGESLTRQSDFLTHPVFHKYHTETKMMRYIRSLENKDLTLATSMIPLGSCTMKLNAATELMPVSWREFNGLHPFVPDDQAQGYHKIFKELEQWLCEITGFAAVSLQPNSGAQGEFTGMMVIRAYHKSRGEGHRDVALIPSSAHGTNPASAVMAGMTVVIVKCDERGNIDVDDLRAKAEQYSDRLAALMVTYPSTHGVFETRIKEICDIVHQHGGQVYMDGANMNAQVGLTSPGLIGADVCHLNLHKTFAIPHGGGGPGVGPICVARHLVPFLPGHVMRKRSPESIPAVAAAPYGSASILLISYGYIKMLGHRGLTEATKYAILNANYIKARLEKHYPVLYTGEKGRCAHELIFDCRPFKEAGIEVEDIAKRLMDYGFHAPTVSFPVAGTIMVEPTESEAKDELDRFCDAMIAIRKEIQEVIDGEADRQDNVLKMAPHTIEEVTADEWQHSYSREKAAFPLPFVKAQKFWPSVARIDNAYGDRNLVCSCPPLEMYAEPSEN